MPITLPLTIWRDIYLTNVPPLSEAIPPLKPRLSHEERMVLACARLPLGQEDREPLAALATRPLDWDRLLRMAQRQQLAPVMYYHLRRLPDRGSAPAGVLDQLQAVYLANVARNLSLQAELWRVVGRLQTAGVPVILLKGSALVGTVYRDPGLRQLSDLDLLVPPEQAHRAQELVQSLGYRAEGNSVAQQDTEKNHRHLPGLMRDDPFAKIEVHRHIVRQDSPLYFDISGFWNRSREQSFQQGRALVLAPEDLLVHLSVNFLQDRRFQSVGAMRQLYDIAQSIRYYRDSLDWGLLAGNASQYRLTGPVGAALYLARQLLDAPVPEGVLRGLDPAVFNSREMERLLRQRVLGDQWVFKELISQRNPYSWWAVPGAVLRRVVPSRRYLAQHDDEEPGSARIYALYLMRLGKAISLAARLARRPRLVGEDLAVDRWLHFLYGEGGTPSGSARRRLVSRVDRRHQMEDH